jgi:RHS repeat-associated protein
MSRIPRTSASEFSPPNSINYSPYGHHKLLSGELGLLGFNGQYLDLFSKCYLLGNGYRTYNPVLMRFNSPDSMSPFGQGGMNTYVYCLVDPINAQDINGHFSVRKWFGRVYERVLQEVGFTRNRRSAARPGGDEVSRGRANSVPTMNFGEPSAPGAAEWDLIGYHGTTRDNAMSLMEGLDPKKMGTGFGLRFGRGFYISATPQVPIGYSRQGRKLGEMPAVVAAYAKNFKNFRLGVHYDYKIHPDSPREIRNLEIVVREPAYKSIEIRETNLRERAVLPLRSYEAPF